MINKDLEDSIYDIAKRRKYEIYELSEIINEKKLNMTRTFSRKFGYMLTRIGYGSFAFHISGNSHVITWKAK